MEIATSAPRPHSRGFSLHSERSAGSKGRSEPLTESPRDKDRKSQLWQGATKANPNAALTEQQPADRTRIEQTTIQNLRNMQHKDASGQIIADPDLSNPTRSRFERPLDTIRAFEKAINNGYKRRSSYTAQQDSADQYDQHNHFASRRSSVFGGEYGPPQSRRRQSTNALMAGLDGGPRASTHALNGGYYGQQRPDSHANGGRQRYGQRLNSDPTLHGAPQPPPQQQQQQQQQQQRYSPQQGYYSSHDYHPAHDYHQSYDTVHTGGSDSTGPWANSTDPSSENSSIDRLQYANKAHMHSDGGAAFHGGHHAPIMEEQGPSQRYSNGHTYGNNGNGVNGYNAGAHSAQGHPALRTAADGYGPNNYGANGHGVNGHGSNGPPVPSHGANGRRPMPANGGYNASRPPVPSSRPEPEKKRKSWLKRRFSRD